jgi:hypothetical protein
VSPLETQLLFARAVLLILLYTFVGAVAVVAYLELHASRRAELEDTPAAPGTRLIILNGADSGRPAGTSLPVASVSAIGRDLDNEIVLADPTVSGRHAVINLREGAWWVEDLGSTNGTYVNGATVELGRPTISRSGDTVRVGAVRMRLVTPEL